MGTFGITRISVVYFNSLYIAGEKERLDPVSNPVAARGLLCTEAIW
jgi:hypothetical protein